MDPVSVLVVDDSALMRNLIKRMLESDADITVVGTAMNGVFALRKVDTLKPDVIVLDLEMPELDGIGFLGERQKRNWDLPVVILSAVAKKGAAVTMKALSLGAADFITKPTGKSENENREVAVTLIGMVKAFGRAYRRKSGRASEAAAKRQADRGASAPKQGRPQSLGVFPRNTGAPLGSTISALPSGRVRDDWPKLEPKRPAADPEIIAIGISTGGPNALRKVFAELSPNLALPIVVVQHMPPGFTAEFASSLNKVSPLEVKEAADGDILKPGRILIAPGDKHVAVEKKALAAIVRCIEGEKINGHMPSAGVLFESVAKTYGNSGVGIIMTGMGRDGSREIGGIYAEGGLTLAQDEESSVVYGMPRVAVEHDYINRVVSLDDMAPTINEIAGA